MNNSEINIQKELLGTIIKECFEKFFKNENEKEKIEFNFSYLDSFTLLIKLRKFLENKSKEGDRSISKLLDKYMDNTYLLSDNIYKSLPADYKKDFLDNYMKN